MLIPEGQYKARATQGRLDVSSEKKREYVVIEFGLLEGEYAGQTVLWKGFFGDKIDSGGKTLTERTVEGLRVCGWKSIYLTDLTGITENEVQIVVQHDHSPSGKPYAKVRFVNRLGGLSMSPNISPDAAKAFAEKMKGAVVAATKAMGSQADTTKPEKLTKPKATPEPLSTPDDEIPF